MRMGRRARTEDEDEGGQRPPEVHNGAEPTWLCSKYYTFDVFS